MKTPNNRYAREPEYICRNQGSAEDREPTDL